MALVERHTNDFLQEAKRLLPELRREINASQGDFMTQVKAIARRTQQLISIGDVARLIEVFALIDRYFHPHNSRYSGISSFISNWLFENLDFRCREGRVSWDVMPAKLRQGYKEQLDSWGVDLWAKRVPQGVEKP